MTTEERTTVVREPEPPGTARRYDRYVDETRTDHAAQRVDAGVTRRHRRLRPDPADHRPPIVLIALDARAGNDLVRAILDISQAFVAPFEGILRTNALTSGGATLDVAAVLALIGWTLLELVVLRSCGSPVRARRLTNQPSNTSPCAAPMPGRFGRRTICHVAVTPAAGRYGIGHSGIGA